MLTTEVENYPGFVEGIMGPELMMRFRDQAARFGTHFITADADSVDLSTRPFQINVGDAALTADVVIISTGATARMLGLPNESRLLGHGVSTCATCDGFFFRDHDIAVIGGGDTALEEANFLTKFARTVTVIHRRDELRASKIMVERAMSNDKIDFAWNSRVDAIHGQDKVTAVTLRDTTTGLTRRLPVTGVFVAIGHDPRNELIKGVIDLDAGGYVQVQGRSTATNVAGVFAAGDLVDHTYRQAITAAGSGCAAALDAERYLTDLDHVAERARGGATERSDHRVGVG